MERLSAESFSPHVGSAFDVQLDGARTLPLELVEVTALGNSPPGAGSRSPFSILFRSASNVVLPQAIYHLEHPALGSLELFLVTIGPDASGMRYEAVFT